MLLIPAATVATPLALKKDAFDATYFLLHQLKILRRAIEELQDYLVRKMAEHRETLKLLRRTGLNHRQIADFETWIKLGAPDPRSGQAQVTQSKNPSAEHWAFKPVKRPAVPAVGR